MLASGHSQVAFRGLTEVRNRMVEAYREVMNMPV
jgi:flagellar hook-basal body complex protein FliE